MTTAPKRHWIMNGAQTVAQAIRDTLGITNPQPGPTPAVTRADIERVVDRWWARPGSQEDLERDLWALVSSSDPAVPEPPRSGCAATSSGRRRAAISDTAWKAVVPSQHGEPNIYYFRTSFDAFAYMPFMEDYGALADITEVSASEVDKYTERPARRTR